MSPIRGDANVRALATRIGSDIVSGAGEHHSPSMAWGVVTYGQKVCQTWESICIPVVSPHRTLQYVLFSTSMQKQHFSMAIAISNSIWNKSKRISILAIHIRFYSSMNCSTTSNKFYGFGIFSSAPQYAISDSNNVRSIQVFTLQNPTAYVDDISSDNRHDANNLKHIPSPRTNLILESLDRY